MNANNTYSLFCKAHGCFWAAFALMFGAAALNIGSWYIFGPLWLIVIVSWFAYMQTMAKLVSHAGKRPFEWVGLTIVTGFIGVFVSYMMMGRVAEKQGWLCGSKKANL